MYYVLFVDLFVVINKIMITNNNDTLHFIKCNKELQAISLKDITYINCDGYICSIYNEEDKLIASQTKLLKNYETELEQFGFVRINRKTIINAKSIKQIDLKNRKIILSNNKIMTVSRRKLIILRKKFEN